MAAQAQKWRRSGPTKKALMQQLFPREGETVPRLRFPEFRGGDHSTLVPLGELLKRKPDTASMSPPFPFRLIFRPICESPISTRMGDSSPKARLQSISQQLTTLISAKATSPSLEPARTLVNLIVIDLKNGEFVVRRLSRYEFDPDQRIAPTSISLELFDDTSLLEMDPRHVSAQWSARGQRY